MAVNFPATLDDDNSLLLAVDLAASTLASALTAAATSISLTSATSFPANGGRIQIEDEIIAFTGKTGNSLTGATRGYSSTTAVAHPAGAAVILAIAADYHNNLKDAVVALETKVGVTGSETHVLVAGDTMTGLLTLSGDPTGVLHAATKQYVDALGGRIQQVSVGIGTAADYNTTSTTFVDLDATNFALTQTFAASEWALLIFQGAALTPSTLSSPQLTFHDGADIGGSLGLFAQTITTVNYYAVAHMSYLYQPGAGAKTFKVRWKIDVGTLTLKGSTGGGNNRFYVERFATP